MELELVSVRLKECPEWLCFIVLVEKGTSFEDVQRIIQFRTTSYTYTEKEAYEYGRVEFSAKHATTLGLEITSLFTGVVMWCLLQQ